jgi:rhodanese-related sulfurtransferase
VFANILSFILILLWMASHNLALAVEPNLVPKEKHTSLGLYLTSNEAYRILDNNANKILFIDVRTLNEVNSVGVPNMVDAIIPYIRSNPNYPSKSSNQYVQYEFNNQFIPEITLKLKGKGLTKKDKILLICRAGGRSAAAVELLAEAGFNKVYSVVDGFEGDPNLNGPLAGTRNINGWKNSNLPWHSVK